MKELNELERIYLQGIDYQLNINGSEYAKYYFILRTISEKSDSAFPLKPLPISKVAELQNNAVKFQENIRAAYERMSKTH